MGRHCCLSQSKRRHCKTSETASFARTLSHFQPLYIYIYISSKIPVAYMPQYLSWYTILKALKNRARGSRTTQKFVQPGSYRVEILLGEGFGFVSNASDDRYLVVARAWLILTWLHASDPVSVASSTNRPRQRGAFGLLLLPLLLLLLLPRLRLRLLLLLLLPPLPLPLVLLLRRRRRLLLLLLQPLLLLLLKPLLCRPLPSAVTGGEYDVYALGSRELAAMCVYVYVYVYKYINTHCACHVYLASVL